MIANEIVYCANAIDIMLMNLMFHSLECAILTLYDILTDHMRKTTKNIW